MGGNGIISVREERMIRGLSSERKNNSNIFFPFLGKSPCRIYVRKEKNLVSVNGILIDGSHYIDSRREDRNCNHSHRNGGKTRDEIMLYFCGNFDVSTVLLDSTI